LAQLSLEHRAVVLMHDSEGYKLDEIHKITGIPVGTLKSRLHRARARLREILTADGTFSADSSCYPEKASEHELQRYTRTAR
jgi:RNA polymerase sigma-70 factor (ECF subfamily)